MERVKLSHITNCAEKNIRIPLLVTDIGDLITPEAGKPYFVVSVTDGEKTAAFPLRDNRVDAARSKFLNTVVYLTLNATGEPFIAKIEPCMDIPVEEFSNAAPAATEHQAPPRFMIRNVNEYMNKTCKLPVLVTGFGPLKESRNFKPYYSVEVTDGKEKASYQMWNDQYEANKDRFTNKIVYLTLNVSEFTKIATIEECNDYPVTEFIHTAPVPSEEMFDEIIATLSCMESSMAAVAIKLYCDNKDKLLRWAGALKMHHSVYGGLLYHAYRMMKAAMNMSDIYPGINRELLIIGAVLHDIGKLRELDTNEFGITAFTADGNLSGHILLGIEMLNEYLYTADEKPDAEEFRLVKHMIASHHGALEFGAIVVPSTPEAMVLNYLDLIDSRMYTYEEELSKMEKGAVSDRVFALGNSHVYKANYTEKAEENAET